MAGNVSRRKGNVRCVKLSGVTPDSILREAIENAAFPGAVAWCARGENVMFHGAQGHLGLAPPFDKPADLNTIYDLASLTKIYVLAAALRCLRAHQIALDTPLAHFLDGFAPSITLAHLMNHSSGLDLHLQALTELPIEQWLPQIRVAPITATPGERVLYLCTNYFLLGRALAQIEGVPLETIVEKYVLKPANLRATFAPMVFANVAPTETDGQGGTFRGIVHDEAARAFRAQTGDCAGNAGVFADARDVGKFGQLWLDNFFHPADVAAVCARPLPEESGARGLGFQIDKPFYMSDKAPPNTWGHLGFTGPSLVIHRATKSVIVLLNNRVHPTRNGPNRMPWHRALAAWSFSDVASVQRMNSRLGG